MSHTPRGRSHRHPRIAVTTAAVTVLAGAAIATASPAQALSGPVQSLAAEPNDTAPTQLIATNLVIEPGLGPIINFPVTIYRVVDGAQQAVASGTGNAVYQCAGAAVHTYTAVGKTLTVPCG